MTRLSLYIEPSLPYLNAPIATFRRSHLLSYNDIQFLSLLLHFPPYPKPPISLCNPIHQKYISRTHNTKYIMQRFWLKPVFVDVRTQSPTSLAVFNLSTTSTTGRYVTPGEVIYRKRNKYLPSVDTSIRAKVPALTVSEDIA
jgi:hypothetical protein